jgi:hypothetical protein
VADWGGGAPRRIGLSALGVAAREGHRLTVVTVTARNSRRSRPVLLFNHANKRFEILRENFAPLLRSRYEGRILVLGVAGMVACILAGLWMPKALRVSNNLGMWLIVGGISLLAPAIQFPSQRRDRLRERLEQTCATMAEGLMAAGDVPEGSIDVAL